MQNNHSCIWWHALKQFVLTCKLYISKSEFLQDYLPHTTSDQVGECHIQSIGANTSLNTSVHYQVHTLLLVLHSYISICCKAILNNFSFRIHFPCLYFPYLQKSQGSLCLSETAGVGCELAILCGSPGSPSTPPGGDMSAQGEAGAGGLLAPSPQSEAVTHEMEELSLQPSQNLPPLNERKNGESTEHTCSPGAGQNVYIHSYCWATNINTHVHFVQLDIVNLGIITWGVLEWYCWLSVTVMGSLLTEDGRLQGYRKNSFQLWKSEIKMYTVYSSDIIRQILLIFCAFGFLLSVLCVCSFIYWIVIYPKYDKYDKSVINLDQI